MSLLEDLEAVIFESETSVAKAIEMFHNAGVTKLPDGRAIEEVVMTHMDYTKGRSR